MLHLVGLVVAIALAWQLSPRMASLVAVVRPLLPYPASTPSGDLPIDNSAASKWFVVWPDESDDTQIIVRANPLHPDVQAASAAAMEEINAAVAAAERRAQASYDRALEELRRTGKSSALENVSLDDEGVAGERIDAELEVTIELQEALTFEIASAEAPVVRNGTDGVAFIVSVPAHTYRQSQDNRERFRAAQSHVYFGDLPAPVVTRRGAAAQYRVDVTPAANAFAIVIRGNADLVSVITSDADWAPLARR